MLPRHVEPSTKLVYLFRDSRGEDEDEEGGGRGQNNRKGGVKIDCLTKKDNIFSCCVRVCVCVCVCVCVLAVKH